MFTPWLRYNRRVPVTRSYKESIKIFLILAPCFSNKVSLEINKLKFMFIFKACGRNYLKTLNTLKIDLGYFDKPPYIFKILVFRM